MSKYDINRVLIVDDHPLFRKGASQLIDLDDRFELAGEATCGSDGVDLAVELNPDLVLLDMNMDDMDGVQTLKAMREAGVESKIIMLTVSNDENDLVAAMRQGANGYLLKDMEPEEILEELDKAISGQVALSENLTNLLVTAMQHDNQNPSLEEASLTDRERQILVLIAKGKNNKTIGRELGITDGTVKVHVKHLLQKLNLSSRLEAAVWAIDQNIDR
jgi:two-component system nitrate/nitrite response regulator NarL